MSTPAVILLSGGLDSATVLALARAQSFLCHALSIDYGQRHSPELDAARRVAQSMGVASHREVKVDLRAIGGSALTDELAVPKNRLEAEISQGIPITYVPARNTVFLSLALGLAEVIGAFDIFVGVNAVDYSGYPDCRPEYIAQFEKLANLATQAGVEGKGRYRIHAPLIQMSKAEIIRKGIALGVDYSLTLSCYSPDTDGRACGSCDSCQIRRKGFVAAGIEDVTRYL
jgi:7-cyano-7-deazaguanine synthase